MNRPRNNAAGASTAAPASHEDDGLAKRLGRPPAGWRRRMYAVIFESDTPAGRLFDLLLVWLILASVAVVMLDSFETLHARWGHAFSVLEWAFTALFTTEYIARLVCVQRPLRYARSVLGVIDLLAVLPTWAALFVPGLHALIDVRLLRLLRLFRILKLAAYVDEYAALGRALKASRRKIMVFLSFVLLVVVVMGTVMYVVEGPANGFTNVPVSVYWAISTMTTVGFGDIAPKTGLGRLIASVMMLIGWGTLAVPTGIVSAEFTAMRVHGRGGVAADTESAAALVGQPAPRRCGNCGSQRHAADARFCCDCGAVLPAAAGAPMPTPAADPTTR